MTHAPSLHVTSPPAPPPFPMLLHTSQLFITATGIFTSSWLGAALLKLGEFIFLKLPLVKHIYSASKQVSAALSPADPDGGGGKAFQQCVLARHPRHGEYAIGFITARTLLQV